MNNSFMDGYSFPRPIVSKLNILATMEERYPYISLTLSLLQNYPQLFKTTANNLLYILNVNRSYKKQSIYDIFKNLLLSNSLATENDLNDEISNKNPDEKYFITDNLLVLFAYYLLKTNQFNHYEPSMIPIHKQLDVFLNNPEVYYNGRKYNLKDFEPISYSINGSSILSLVPYFAYIATFYIYGKPYTFYEDYGSGSTTTGLFNAINTYFGEFYKKLCNDTKIMPDSMEPKSWYSAFEQQMMDFQSTLNRMLNYSSLIELRNREMNKAESLLDDCFKDQNDLKESYLQQRYGEVIDELVKIIVEYNPLRTLFDKFPVFEPLDIDNNMRTLNIIELMDMTEYCISGGQSSFVIKPDMSYLAVDPRLNKDLSIGGIIQPQILISKINTYLKSLKIPFSNSDILTKMLKEFIKSRFMEQQSSFLSTPDIEEPISISFSDFTTNIKDELMNLFVQGIWKTSYAEMNIILASLINSEPYFKRDINNILNLWNITKNVYSQVPKAFSMPVYIMSYLKEAVLDFIKAGQTDFSNFSFMNWIFNHVVVTMADESLMRMRKIYDMCISLAFIHSDAYARFVNLAIRDFEKYTLNGIVEIPFIQTNNDKGYFYAMGGCKLYNKMLDPNPLNRGYEFLSQMIGTSENLEIFHNIVKDLKDTKSLTLISKTTNSETILDILQDYAQDLHKKEIEITDFLFVDSNKLRFTQKNRFDWINLKNINNEFIYSYLLEFAFKQVVGLPQDPEFKSVLIDINKNEIEAVGLTVGGFNYTGKHKEFIPVNVQDHAESFNIPVYNYASEMKVESLSFAYPEGHKLLTFTLDSEMTVFLFTPAKLNVNFNSYDINS